MKTINDTQFVAGVYRSQLFYRDLTLATAVVKASFEVGADANIALTPDPLAIVIDGAPTPFGELESDVVPLKAGCDFAVYGAATSPHPISAIDVSVRVGEFVRRVRVTGDRRWIATPNGVRASSPEPFTSIQIDYAHAYGGEALHEDDMVVDYSDNPAGMGFIALPEHAAGTRLANVEEIDQLITAPEQRVMPAGLAPLPRRSSLRGLRGVEADLEQRRTTLRPTAFVWSHPRMHLSAYPAGAPVCVQGMTVEPEWRFALPLIAVNARVRLGSREHVLRLVPDTLGIVPGHRRFWVVLRRAFIYQYVPEQLREVRLELATHPDSAETPTTTISRELGAASPVVRIEPPEPPEKMPIPWEVLRDMHPLTAIIESLPLCASG